MLLGYKLKKLAIDPTNPDITTLKLACESVYLSLKLIFMAKYPREVPPFSIYKLLDVAVTSGVVNDKEWLEGLIRERIDRKEGQYRIGGEFRDFVDLALGLKVEVGEGKDEEMLV